MTRGSRRDEQERPVTTTLKIRWSGCGCRLLVGCRGEVGRARRIGQAERAEGVPMAGCGLALLGSGSL